MYEIDLKVLKYKTPTDQLLTIIVFPVSYILYQTGEKQLSEMAYDKIHKAGRNVVHQLELRTTTAKSLAFALVALAKNLPADEKQYKQLARQTIDFIGTEHFIAGGGIWPEPFQFNKNIELTAYPNPADELLNLSFKLNRNADIKISLFDYMGKEVKSINKGKQNIGTQIIQMNVSDISAGFYFLRMQINNRVETVKLIIK